MIKAVLFDMDGVLIDSVALGRNLRERILAEHYGINLAEVPDPQGQDHRVASMKTMLASIASHLGVAIKLEEFAEIQAQYMRDELPKLVSVDPALLTFLDELNEHDIACAVVTTAQRTGTDIKLNVLGVREYFSVIVTGNDVDAHKPDPAAYLYALDKLGLPATECIIFEDSLPGVQAGIAAGCRVIGFTQYNPPSEPLPGVLATVERWHDMDYDRLLSLEKNTSRM